MTKGLHRVASQMKETNQEGMGEIPVRQRPELLPQIDRKDNGEGALVSGTQRRCLCGDDCLTGWPSLEELSKKRARSKHLFILLLPFPSLPVPLPAKPQG
jgi:hypothetical protein